MDLDNIELLYTKVNNGNASKNDLKQFVSIANKDEIVNIIWNQRKRFQYEQLKYNRMKKCIDKVKEYINMLREHNLISLSTNNVINDIITIMNRGQF